MRKLLSGIVAAAVGLVSATFPGTAARASTADEVTQAISYVERFWAGQFPGFQPVRPILGYTQAGQVSCAGVPLGLQNASYCTPGKFIAYDAGFLAAGDQQIGDSFVWLVLAHEYGHAVQDQRHLPEPSTVYQELQADCFAGGALGAGVRSGALVMEDGDLAEIGRTLSLGQQAGVPWYLAGDHGSAEQRMAAFTLGFTQGVNACLS